MRDYAKVGGRKGMPGYRTPAVFRYKKSLKVNAIRKTRDADKSDNVKKGFSKKVSVL